MKRLLFLFDTDPRPSVFDTVVGYDGGADHVAGYGGVSPAEVAALVDGAIYTRGGADKKSTAIFVGGGDLQAGEALFSAVRERFFGQFRVSCMLDSNGSNTTAAAGVALAAKAAGSLEGRRAVVLAGTGPVGMRTAALLAREGAEVVIAGRAPDRTQAAAASINARFGVDVAAAATPDEASRIALVEGSHVVFSAGAGGVELLPERAWAEGSSPAVLADYNPQPPAGIGGIEALDKGRERHGARTFGALGIGGLKLRLHRACIARLFESNAQVLDAEEIYALAKAMA